MDLRAEYLPPVVVFIFACCSNGEATYIVYTGVFVLRSVQQHVLLAYVATV